jgi:hypothetical protein
MPFTKDQIVSRSLTILGKGPISTIANGGDIAAALSEGYDFIYPKEITEGAWRFAVKYDQLSQVALVTIPNEIPYNYVYQLPTDLLFLWRLWPRTLDFQIYEDWLYANIGGAQALYAEYRFLPNILNVPMYFSNYLAYALAADYAMPVTNNERYIEVIKSQAEMERAKAMAIDAQQHPNLGIQDQPYIEVRGGGGARK